jgi:hypothetical protein
MFFTRQQCDRKEEQGQHALPNSLLKQRTPSEGKPCGANSGPGIFLRQQHSSPLPAPKLASQLNVLFTWHGTSKSARAITGGAKQQPLWSQQPAWGTASHCKPDFLSVDNGSNHHVCI